MSVASDKNPAKQLALKIYNRIPIIFSSTGTTEVAGTRLKCQFNENSKMTAIHSVLPELCHNEIVNLSKVNRAELKFPLLILEDGSDHPRVKLRIKILQELLKDNLTDLFEIKCHGESKLARILSLIYLGDYLSVYCALLRNEDPSPVMVIENLKKQLAKS
jgi:glucose/mannose-6-phosphate isomerase